MKEINVAKVGGLYSTWMKQTNLCVFFRGHPDAVEPIIGHMKAEHRMGRNYLKGRDGDRINAVLAAAGYNFSLLLRCLQRLLRAVMRILLATPAPAQNA
jgi:hypothetical protein